jgi:hypothetical protein
MTTVDDVDGADDLDDELIFIDDEDGDATTDADTCSRVRCGCPRAVHTDGWGVCTCGNCPRFLD